MPSESATPGVPAYQHIKQQLRQLIAQGGHPSDVPFITQREICEQYDVSMGTAVRVLNDLVAEGILVRHRGRGTFIADHPTPEATGQSRSVVFIVHGVGSHRSEIQRGVAATAADCGYRLYVTDSSASDAEEQRALEDAIEAQVSGVVLYPRDGAGHPTVLAEMRRRGIPVVLVDRYLPSYPTDAVLADNFALGYRLTAELVNRGHRQIATLWAEPHTTSVNDRLSGHIRALQESDIEIRPDFTSLRAYLGLPDRSRVAILESLLESPEPPTALACANGPVLATAISDLLGLGRHIPEDIDVAGMDEMGPFDLLPVAGAAGVLPSYEMGATAMGMLADRIGGEASAPPHHEVLPIDIRTRSLSSAHFRPVDASARRWR